MSRPVLTLVLALLPASCAAPAPQQEGPFPVAPGSKLYGRQVNFGIGLRSFDDEGFGKLDEQVALTLDYAEPIGYEHVLLEGGLHYSQEDTSQRDAMNMVQRVKAETLELSVGLNASVLVGRMRPYAGLGASMLFLNLRGLDDTSGTVFEDDETTIGGYLKGGLLFQISRTSHIGVELRHFEGGDVNLEGTELETTSDQLVFVFGSRLR